MNTTQTMPPTVCPRCGEQSTTLAKYGICPNPDCSTGRTPAPDVMAERMVALIEARGFSALDPFQVGLIHTLATCLVRGGWCITKQNPTIPGGRYVKRIVDDMSRRVTTPEPTSADDAEHFYGRAPTA